MKKESNNIELRESFSGKTGFILSCIGSSIGMGNIWLFPYRVGQYGGGAFLIPYIFFVIIIGFSGIVGEMAFGRAMGTGPWGAFKKSIEMRGWKFGKNLGLIPAFGSWLIAIGYSVVVGWIICFIKGILTYEIFNIGSEEYFTIMVSDPKNLLYCAVGLVTVLIIMCFGVSKGIETINKILMPVFFLVFIFLAVKVYFMQGSNYGYNYIFRVDWNYFSAPKTWVYALGQAFFSLSLAGSGTIIYGSYLKKTENIIFCAGNVALFDTIAALLSSLVIIPSVFMFSFPLNSGPSLLFITMPEIFAQIPGSKIFCLIFFIAVLFAALTSLINLFETPVEMIQYKFKFSRKTSSFITICMALIVAFFIEKFNIVGKWMDIISIYIIPLGALLAGIMFFGVCGDKFVREQVQLGREKKVKKWFLPICKYVFIGLTLVVYILGIFYGGIG